MSLRMDEVQVVDALVRDATRSAERAHRTWSQELRHCKAPETVDRLFHILDPRRFSECLLVSLGLLTIEL